jgi:hypothetical protein
MNSVAVNAPNANGPLNFLFGKSNKKANNSLNSANVTRKNGANANAMNSPMKGGARVGSRVQVYHGTAHHTSGGLTRKDLFMNKRGRIVSRKASAAGKKALKRLHAAGYKAKKGTFKLFHRK